MTDLGQLSWGRRGRPAGREGSHEVALSSPPQPLIYSTQKSNRKASSPTPFPLTQGVERGFLLFPRELGTGLGRASLLLLRVSPAQAPRPLTGKSDGRWAEAGGSQAGTRPGGGERGRCGGGVPGSERMLWPHRPRTRRLTWSLVSRDQLISAPGFLGLVCKQETEETSAGTVGLGRHPRLFICSLLLHFSISMTQTQPAFGPPFSVSQMKSFLNRVFPFS